MMRLLLSLNRSGLLCRLVLIHDGHDAKQVIRSRCTRLDLIWLRNLHSCIIVDCQKLLRQQAETVFEQPVLALYMLVLFELVHLTVVDDDFFVELLF